MSHDPRLTIYVDLRRTTSIWVADDGTEWGSAPEEILEAEETALEVAEFAMRNRVEVRVLTTEQDVPPSVPFIQWHVDQILSRCDVRRLASDAEAQDHLGATLFLIFSKLRGTHDQWVFLSHVRQRSEGMRPALGAIGRVADEKFLEWVRAAHRRFSYRAYLRSEDWDRRRRAALKAAGNRCQMCNADAPLDVHHRTYERFGHELSADLIALCRECHERHHVALARPS